MEVEALMAAVRGHTDLTRETKAAAETALKKGRYDRMGNMLKNLQCPI